MGRKSLHVSYAGHHHEIALHLFIYIAPVLQRVIVKGWGGSRQHELVLLLVDGLHLWREGELAIGVDLLEVVIAEGGMVFCG